MSKKLQRGNKEHKKLKQDKQTKTITADPFGRGMAVKAGSKGK